MSSNKINSYEFKNNLDFAKQCDQKDPLSKFRNEFDFPQHTNNGKKQDQLYFAGHSLGLRPKKAATYINEELEAWKEFGVEGHFKGAHPWMPYHEFVTESLARLVGAKTTEVVGMNSLTVNLHLMMVSFYRPTKQKFKILIENNTFPSDKYAVDSQARFHGFNAEEAIVELKESKEKGLTVDTEAIIQQIKHLGPSLSLVMLGNCNYLSGQKFDFEKIVEAAHSVGAFVGFNLAHGAGNLALKLHDWNVDFAVWCSYKYMNAGPGGLAGAYIHEKHHSDPQIPRFEGWWGHDKTTRFKMGPQFKAIPTAEAWQLSNPPIFQLASLRASLELFDAAGIENLRKRGDQLTSYFEWLIKENLPKQASVITPSERGSMLCLRFHSNPQKLKDLLIEQGAIVDFREPDIIRATPAPLYNSYEDIYKFVDLMKQSVQ